MWIISIRAIDVVPVVAPTETTSIGQSWPGAAADPAWFAVDLGARHIVRAVSLSAPGDDQEVALRVGDASPPRLADPLCASLSPAVTSSKVPSTLRETFPFWRVSLLHS